VIGDAEWRESEGRGYIQMSGSSGETGNEKAKGGGGRLDGA
jgi:hypothetical protein